MKTCLVVDDSSVIRKVAKRILEGMEFQIMEAEDGQQALDQCQRMLPDAILLDWNMPVMNGLEFLQRVQKEPAYQPIPVIIISTEGKEEDTIRGLKMGAKGYVKKPFQASELHSLIEKITSAS